MNVSMVRRRRSPTSIASAIEILSLIISLCPHSTTVTTATMCPLSLTRTHTHAQRRNCFLLRASKRTTQRDSKSDFERAIGPQRDGDHFYGMYAVAIYGRKEGRGGTGSIDFRPSVILSTSFVSTASQWRDRLNTPMGPLSSLFAWVWRFFFHLQRIDALNSYRNDLIIAFSQ